ncbi:MAG TPA: TRAM domain-containing protein [Candidatus Aminicenantes bacterium]|nr:MAG: PIN domain nuclease [Candidatus Aminicenantes bacterium]HEK85493.1 TRAM domain-containing protein [Candidatus Aminicenantes bacterium]
MGLLVFRLIFVLLISAAGYFYPPFIMNRLVGLLIGFLLAILLIFLEGRLRRASFRIIWTTSLGTLLGVLLGWLLGSIYLTVVRPTQLANFLRLFFLIAFPYLGFLVGLKKPEWLEPGFFISFFQGKSESHIYKLLDTSVIIDGRIAEVCETGFIDGSLVVPQFVLKELQLVADSPDPLKRQRGRRGLEVLDRLQKIVKVKVIISELDFPEIKEVDSKLIECAKALKAKIITNDFNLNKIAKLQGIEVLNINELVNALRPIVLPGESMRVFILKEGKEKDQGVAYLDDGTMVVVDNARRMIGQTVDITVTSVLQTTVGKMIFGRYNSDLH